MQADSIIAALQML